MTLDAGWAALAGAGIGAAATIAGNIATVLIQNQRATGLARKRRERLRQMLAGDKYTWRSLPVLAASIGADERTTAELLIEINARASLTNSDSWALVSRAPWPADMQPES